MARDDERYIESSGWLFPRFLVGASSLVLLEFLINLVIALLIPVRPSVPAPSVPIVQPRFEAFEAVSYLYPLAFFGLFYLVSRVRVNLGSDYLGVAASIFAGALVISLIVSYLGNFGLTQSSTGVLDSLIQDTAAAVLAAVQFTFIGFAAVLLSYRRRM